jgi:hypothetical protein
MGVVVVGLDNISFDVEMGLDELLIEYVQVVNESVAVRIHDQLHLLQAWHRVPESGR